MLSLLSVGTANASFDSAYAEKLNYAISSEKMYGHLAASLSAFLGDEEYQYLARAHLGHAMAQEFENSHVFLQNYPDYYRSSINTLNSIIGDPDLDKQSFEARAKDVIKIIRHGQNLILGEQIVRSDRFNLLITTSLLETAKDSLIDSKNVTGASQVMLRQDALGFVVRADMKFKNIEGMESEQFESTSNLLEEYFLISDYGGNVDDQIKILDKMLIELYYYTIEHNISFSFTEESVAVQSERVDLKVEGKPGNNIVSIVGEGFEPNSILDVSYVTYDSEDPIKLKIRTTSNGDFFIPIEVNVNEKTYYVSVSTSKISTLYVLD